MGFKLRKYVHVPSAGKASSKSQNRPASFTVLVPMSNRQPPDTNEPSIGSVQMDGGFVRDGSAA